MLAAALEAEAAAYVERFRGEQDPNGRALVVLNGRARPRRVTVGSGTLESRPHESMIEESMPKESGSVSPARSFLLT
jgi:hypothetical protein